MQIQMIDRREGLPPQEIVGRLAGGWLCITNIAIEAPALAVPGQPDVGKSVDIWMPPPFGAMMPQLAVVQAMLHLGNQDNDIITLDNLAKMLFHKSLRELSDALAGANEEPEGEPGKENDA